MLKSCQAYRLEDDLNYALPKLDTMILTVFSNLTNSLILSLHPWKCPAKFGGLKGMGVWTLISGSRITYTFKCSWQDRFLQLTDIIHKLLGESKKLKIITPFSRETNPMSQEKLTAGLHFCFLHSKTDDITKFHVLYPLDTPFSQNLLTYAIYLTLF